VSPPLEQRIERDSSFERLYRLHRRDVYGAVLRDVRDPAEAEDVTQIAFLNAFRAMRKGEQPDKPRAWLVTIARNVIRRRYRELMRRPQEVALDPEVVATLAEVDGPTAEEITAAIRRLPTNQRTVILLREIQGRTYAEIAQEMGLSLAAVETLIFRARRSLSEELESADRAPATRRRARGLFFLPIPGLSKITFGFSLGRAGIAALVGGVAIVTVPIESGAERVRPPVDRPASSVPFVGVPTTPPTVLSPVTTEPAVREKDARGKDGPGAKGSDSRTDGDTSPQGASEPTAPVAEVVDGVDVVAVPDLPTVEDIAVPPLPVELPPPLDEPSVPELPPPPPILD
jgi:RNA polymerase sigma factor (sigma-70 family)